MSFLINKNKDNFVKASIVGGGASTTTVNAKADKVIGAVAGNLATLDASGNLVDSGLKPENIVGIFEPTNIYVNLINGVDTNLGTQDSPFLTIEKALLSATAQDLTIYITSNSTISQNNFTLIGSYIPTRITFASLSQEKIIFNIVTLEQSNLGNTRFITFQNIKINGLTSYVNTTLINCELTQTIKYYANVVSISEIKYTNVNYTNAFHEFAYNGSPVASSKWSEDATCSGNILSLPLILEDVITATIIPPDHSTLTFGDRFLISNGTNALLPQASGEWLGQDNKIATWNSTDWDYQPLVTGNAVTTQESPKRSFIYQGTYWQPTALWILSTRIADSISAGLMSTTDYSKLLYSSTATNIKISNNLPEEKLKFNPSSTYYEFIYLIKFSKIVVIPELNEELITSVDNNYPVNVLVRGNIIITLPDPREDPNKSSFAYDGDVFKVQLIENPFNIDNIVVKAPNGLTIKQNGTDIAGNVGVIVGRNVETVFRWSDNNPDPNNKIKPVGYEIL